MSDDLWLLVLVCSLGTYAWRAAGVLLAGRIDPAGEVFRWTTCVAYAMIAGLVMRILLIPSGPLAASLWEHRLLACVISVVVYRRCGRSLFLAALAGATSLSLLNELRGVFG